MGGWSMGCYLTIWVRDLVDRVRRQRLLVALWWGPGLAVSWWLRDSIAWVNFLSIYAILRTEQGILDTRIAQAKIEEAGGLTGSGEAD